MENKSQEDANPLFEISRVRYFYRFKSPSTLNIEEEITYVNKSDGPVDYVPYDLNEFKPFLHIFDASGERLEFYRSEDAADKIKIELPDGKSLEKDKRKTIRLGYVKEFAFERTRGQADRVIRHDEFAEYDSFDRVIEEEETFRDVWLKIPLYRTANVYVYIEKFKEYLFEAEYYISSTSEGPMPEIIVDQGTTYVHFQANKDPHERVLAIRYRHVQPPDPAPSSFDSLVGYLGWHNCGIAIGALTCLAILWIKSKHASEYSFADIVTFSALIITILVIIEGWLFDKNMNSEIVKKYDIAYKAIIAIILIEIGVFHII